jgi:hypothetical protein
VICIKSQAFFKTGAGTSEKNRQSSDIFLEILKLPNPAKLENHMWKILQGKFEKKECLNRSFEQKVIPILRRTLHNRFLLRSKLDRIDEYGGSGWGSYD